MIPCFNNFFFLVQYMTQYSESSRRFEKGATLDIQIQVFNNFVNKARNSMQPVLKQREFY